MPVLSAARVATFVGGGVTSVPSCTTTADSNTTGSTNRAFANGATYRRAGRFAPSSSYDLCKIDLRLRKVLAPTSGNISCKIYSDSSNLPSSVLGTASNTVAVSSLTTSNAWYTFTFSPAVSLTGSTNYWVSVETDALNDSSNYARWVEYNAGTQRTAYYNASWASQDTTATLYFRAYR